MPWKVCDRMSVREEFVRLVQAGNLSKSELCRRYGISRRTGYKWLKRYESEGREGLSDQSRRPLNSPSKTSGELEDAVLSLREAHPEWGGRKLRRRLQDLGHEGVPSASTITEILRRHGRLREPERATRDFQRFEHEEPNDLWQMDFKGHFATGSGRRCHPLTVLDDHSRFSLCLRALDCERGEQVQQELITVFLRYGMPRAMLMDNGPPWGDEAGSQTRWTVWLMRQGIRVTHGRAYHPQTQGKEERFHRTLKAEVLQGREFADLPECQRRFDVWREVYNHERPHESLGLSVPASRFRASEREYQGHPAAWEYSPGMEVRKVDSSGKYSFRGRQYKAGKAYVGQQLGLRAEEADGLWSVWFCRTRLQQIDLRAG